jgi:hypothetical protein
MAHVKLYVKNPKNGARLICFSEKDAAKVAAKIDGATVIRVPATR